MRPDSCAQASSRALDGVELAIEASLRGREGLGKEAVLTLDEEDRESFAVATRLKARMGGLTRSGSCRSCWLQQAHCVCDRETERRPCQSSQRLRREAFLRSPQNPVVSFRLEERERDKARFPSSRCRSSRSFVRQKVVGRSSRVFFPTTPLFLSLSLGCPPVDESGERRFERIFMLTHHKEVISPSVYSSAS